MRVVFFLTGEGDLTASNAISSPSFISRPDAGPLAKAADNLSQEKAMAAKNKGDGGPGKANKFRFIMFEGDMSDENIGALAHVFASAVRPAPAPVPRLLARSSSALGSDNGAPEDVEEVETANLDLVEEAESAPAPKARSSSGSRKYPQARVMTDVDLESNVSFPDFAARKQPNNVQDRYLIAAAWYKLHRSMDAITMHHIYTCFLHPRVNWSTRAADFDQPLRQLVKVKRLGRGERGFYAINGIGMADVELLTTSGE